MNTHHFRIAQTQVGLGDPAKAPARTRAALERGAQLAAAYSDALIARDRLAVELKRVEAEEPVRHGRALFEGTTVEGNPVADARKALEAAYGNIGAVEEAQRLALTEIRRAVAADRETWGASSVATAEKALLKLTTAVRMADEARVDLADSIGILAMFRQHEENGGGNLARVHGRGSHIFSLGAGIEGLRVAIAEATHELAALKPKKSKKAAAGAEAADQ